MHYIIKTRHYFHLKAVGRPPVAVHANTLDEAVAKAGYTYLEMLWADEDGVTVWERA